MREHSLGLGPVWGHLLATSAIVATANSLGAWWLETPIAGIPAGLWCVGLGGFLGVLHANRQQKPEDRGWATRSLEAPARRLAGRVLECAGRACESAGERFGFSAPTRAASAIARAFEPRSAGLRLRVGLCIDRELAAALARSQGGLDIEWVGVDARASGDLAQRSIRSARLDALLVRPSHGPVRIILPEHPEREAAWFDWACERPLTYASVFPLRVDPAQVTLGDLAWHDQEEVHLARGIVEAACVLARHEARLSPADRIAGRTACVGARVPESRGSGVVLALADHLARAPDSSPLARLAARVVGAFLASDAERVRPERRRAGIERAFEFLRDEPEAAFRAAASRLSEGREDDAGRAIRVGESLVRARGATTHVDHLAFIQSELSTGLGRDDGAFTFGRIGAGLGMLVACTPIERIDYLKDDVGEDLKFSGLLVGRDHDHAALLSFLRRLCGDRVASRAA